MQPPLEDSQKHIAPAVAPDAGEPEPAHAGQPGVSDAVQHVRTLEALEDEIAELAAHIDAATYRLLRLIAEFDRREGWATGFCSCAHWLSFRVGISLVTAREKVRVARALDGLPLISAAMAGGRISYSKVRELTRIATPENEEDLVELAQAGTASHVQRVVRAFRRTELAQLETAERQREGRYLNLYTDDNGMLVVEGRLPAEVGALLSRAVETAEQELRQQRREQERRQQQGPSGDASAAARAAEAHRQRGAPDASAEALAAEARRQGGAPDASAEARAAEASPQRGARDASAEARGQDRASWAGTAGQRRADALGLVAERALAGMGSAERGQPVQVVLHVEERVLAEPTVDGGTCHVEDGPALAAETARRLSCDAPEVRLTEDAGGQPLDLGRKRRRVSAALYRALRARDRTCAFPGCEATGRLTPHHIEHWASGGRTDRANLTMLCPAHHWYVHEGGCEVKGRSPDKLTFYSPAGIELKERYESPPLPDDPVAALKVLNAAEGLDIDAETNLIWWMGEQLDMEWALAMLQPLSGSSDNSN